MYPPGVEPGFPAPEAGVLSIRLRVQSLYFNPLNAIYQGWWWEGETGFNLLNFGLFFVIILGINLRRDLWIIKIENYLVKS